VAVPDTPENSTTVQTGVHMRSNNAFAGITDNIEQTVVSKVTEVATKTTKSTPTVPADDTLLTEAQLVKMSEKDYMNPAQLAFFKARLQQLEKDLLKNAGETTEHLRETVLVPDPADRATIEEEHALELRTRDRERKLLKKVQQSIASIDGGEYGWCEETGEPIGIPRLLARPTATLSLEAQQRRELKQKLYGD
jgi:DnaK suppressor protein